MNTTQPNNESGTMTTTKTPGYNSKITIRIKNDKNGRPMAHFWGVARRWIKMNLDEARMLLATEQAWDHNED